VCDTVWRVGCEWMFERPSSSSDAPTPGACVMCTSYSNMRVCCMSCLLSVAACAGGCAYSISEPQFDADLTLFDV
jgi:hypothetical protein